MWLYFGLAFIFYWNIRFIESAVFFPSNSAYGIFAAIAVPIDLGPQRNVFVSYNFEANYNLPVNWQFPSYVDGIGEDDRRMKDNDNKLEEYNSSPLSNKTNSNLSIPTNTTLVEGSKKKKKKHKGAKKREERSLLSRKIFYDILKQRLKMYGYEGESCLLRTICETNASGIGDANGFLGSIFHIIFAPSTSNDENIAPIYYKAEYDGQHSGCEEYEENCRDNILDLISTSVHDIITKRIKK